MGYEAGSAHTDRRNQRQTAPPWQISYAGWRDIALRTKNEVGNDHLSLIAAGVAYYAMLAIFPALVALVSIYGMILDPEDVQRQFLALSGILPEEARNLLGRQLEAIVASSDTALSFTALGAVALALWSAMKGTKAIITALNIVYDEEEGRGFLRLNAVSFLLTVGIVLYGAVALGIVVLLPPLFGFIGLRAEVRDLISVGRWPLMALALIVVLSFIYRFAPHRHDPRWQLVSWGAVLATILWTGGSALFSYYVANFGSFNETYGSVGAVIILLIWFYLSAFFVLLGAEINSEVEHQIRQGTGRLSAEDKQA